MKNLTIKAGALTQIIKTLSTVINKSSVFPILETIKFSAGQALATDLETSMYMAIDWIGQSVAIPAAILSQLVKTLKKETEITFSVDPQTFAVTILTAGENGTQMTKSMISGENPEDFPKLPKFEPVNTFDLSNDMLSNFYEAIKYVSKDELKPALTGVYISNDTITATDNFRMFKKAPGITMFSDSNDSLILSPRALDLLRRAKVTECNVQTCKTNVQYTAPGLTVISRNIDSKYTTITIEDKPVHTFAADRTAIVQAVNIATLYAPKYKSDKTRPIFFRAQNSLLSVYSADYDFCNTACENVFNMHTSRENYVFCFDGAKAKDMLNSMSGDVITFAHSEDGKINICDNAGNELILMHMQSTENRPIYDIFNYSFDQCHADLIATSLEYVNTQLNKYSEQLAVLLESETEDKKDITTKVNQYHWDLAFQKQLLANCTNNTQRKPIRKEIENLERSISFQKIRFDGIESRKADLQSKIEHYTAEKIKTENELQTAIAAIPTMSEVIENCENVQDVCHTIAIDAMIDEMLSTYENMDLTFEAAKPSETANIAPLLDIYSALDMDYIAPIPAPVATEPSAAPALAPVNVPAVMVNIMITGPVETAAEPAPYEVVKATRVYQGRDGWTAKTTVKAGDQTYRIETGKAYRAGTLQSDAQIIDIQPDGSAIIDIMGNPAIKLKTTEGKATEKKITEMHAEALDIFAAKITNGEIEAKKGYQIEIGQILFTDFIQYDARGARAVYAIEGRNYKTVLLDASGFKTDDFVKNYKDKFGIGVYYNEGEKISAAEVEALLIKTRENMAAAAEAKKQADEEAAKIRAEKIAIGAKIVPTMPTFSSIITAEERINESDLHTDYFGSRCGEIIYLAFSAHNRDIFAELRKACLNCDREDIRALATAPETAEHREKYTGGAGYYLSTGHRHSGWMVSKDKYTNITLEMLQIAAAEGRYFCHIEAKPEPKAPNDSTFSAPQIAADEVQIIDYSEKSIAVIGNTKPIKDQLKALGGRFNFRLTCGAGWVFSKTKQAELMAALAPAEASEQAPEVIEEEKIEDLKDQQIIDRCNDCIKNGLAYDEYAKELNARGVVYNARISSDQGAELYIGSPLKTVGNYSYKYNGYWEKWQVYSNDGEPAGEFNTEEEAIEECKRATLPPAVLCAVSISPAEDVQTEPEYITAFSMLGSRDLYMFKKFSCLGKKWSICATYGKTPYICIINKSLPKSMQFGKTFQIWDEAVKHYSSAEMKTALLMLESEFKATFSPNPVEDTTDDTAAEIERFLGI